MVSKMAINRETKGDELGLNNRQECQEPQTSLTHFYMSSPFRGSLNSSSPTVSELQKGTIPSPVKRPLSFPHTRQAGSSKVPVLDAPCHYPPRNLDPSPVTLSTRNFLNKLSSGIEESPPKDSPSSPIGQAPDGTSDIEILATSATHPSVSSPCKESAETDFPEILTTSHSSDIVDASLCTSLLVPAETIEKSGCNSPTVTPQRDLLPPRFPPRKLIRRLHTSNEEPLVTVGSSLMNDQVLKAPPFMSLSDDVCQETSTCTQEPCCSINAGKSGFHARSSCYLTFHLLCNC